MAERKIHNYPSAIIADLTQEKEGFDPSVSGYQKKYIWAVCRYCGKPSRILGKNFKRSGSACHEECRLSEQSECGSPFADKAVKAKADQTIRALYSKAEIGVRISNGKKRHDWRDELSVLVDAPYTSKAVNDFQIDWFDAKANLGIVFNNNVTHSELHLEPKVARSLQYSKTKQCQEQGVRLFHIFEYMWRDRRKQVASFLRSALGRNKQFVHARECSLSHDVGPNLIDESHIQGSTSNTIKSFDLMFEGKHVGSMTAAKHHRQNVDENTIVLSRLAFADGITVRGGASRLFKAFVDWANIEGYSRIVSWSDSSWTNGDIYKTLKFTLEEDFGPDYFYWDAAKDRYLSKQSQRKSNTDCPSDMTEREWALQRGLYRIWDCGKKRWVYGL